MQVTDTTQYGVNLLIRNTSDYPWSRFFASVVIRDSTEHTLDSVLTQAVLFDPGTGIPAGKSGLGDLYEHEIPVRTAWKAPYSGPVTIRVSQMMRVDSLSGIVSAGIRLHP